DPGAAAGEAPPRPRVRTRPGGREPHRLAQPGHRRAQHGAAAPRDPALDRPGHLQAARRARPGV
ncbi:MAG: hypothetical protein AVDCRST_MAG41-874, partial [uncultured Corynebacteriales bacterium]